MNTTDRNTAQFDAQARQLHQAALHSIDPATLARLRAARHEATQASAPGRRRGLWLATACSALLALGVGVHLEQQTQMPAATAPALVASLDADEVLDQNPDLYVWLGSDNALAMEQTR
ncbi:MAG TPA: hypothetical protein VD865_11185 [Stenotrophomonas sp.]|nr:hypothetical protein [Stenotrophomonas sp.]